MLNRFILGSNGRERTVRGLAEMFYGDQLPERGTYSINDETGLNYFGEYLERHIQTNINIYEIMAAVAYRPLTNMEGYQIYDGQFELFEERVNEERTNNGSFELELLYAMFLQKLNKDNLANDVITGIVESLELDKKFLVFTLSIQEGYLKLGEQMRKIIVNKLNEGCFTIDVEGLSSKALDTFSSLQFKTELPVLKNIFKVYKLKKSDFKNNPEKLEAYKALRRFGTKDSDYDKCNCVLNLNKQNFYFLALKIANETYVEGASMVKANNALIEMLNANINPNSDLYMMLPKLRIRVSGGYYTDVFSFKLIDFSYVEKEYFDNVIEMFGGYRQRIVFEQIANLTKREDFIQYLLDKKDSELAKCERKLVMKVIFESSDDDILNKYYEIIKNQKNLAADDIAILCNKGFTDMDTIFDSLFYKDDNNNWHAMDTLGDMLNACISHNLENVLVEILNKIVNDKTIIEQFFWRDRVFINTINFLNDKFINSECDQEIKKMVIEKLNDFVFMYASGFYYKFILNNIDDEFFKDTLSISEVDIKTIGSYLLERDYIKLSSSSVIEQIKKLVYDEQEIAFESCKKVIDSYVSDSIVYKTCNSPSRISEVMESIQDKSRVSQYYKDKVVNLHYNFDNNATFVDSLRIMLKLGLISEEEATDMIKNKVMEMAV